MVARRLTTACHDDTHKRHQHAWTLLYSARPWGAPRPRPWTVLDILAMLCKQGAGGSSPLSSTWEHVARSDPGDLQALGPAV